MCEILKNEMTMKLVIMILMKMIVMATMIINGVMNNGNEMIMIMMIMKWK